MIEGQSIGQHIFDDKSNVCDKVYTMLSRIKIRINSRKKELLRLSPSQLVKSDKGDAKNVFTVLL